MKINFTNIVTSVFKSEIQSVDFRNKTKTAEIINSWVKSKTNSQIKDLVNPNSINSDTKMLLVNAVHFKGTWAYQFDKSLTSKDVFYLDDQRRGSATYMKLYGVKLPFCQLDLLEARAFELPYSNSNVSMMIIRPMRISLSLLESNLKTLDILKISKGMQEQTLNIVVPRFWVAYDFKLSKQFGDVSV